MSKDYECRVSHVIQNGETTISVKCRVGPPYRGDMAITVKRAKNGETAAMRALKSFLAVD